MNISASLVLFNSPVRQFESCIDSFLAACPEGVLHVADNSADPLISQRFTHSRVVYRHMSRNLGFGAAHNVCMRDACTRSDIHLLLNPDVHFGTDVIEALSAAFTQDLNLMAAMPQIRYPDGTLQRLCKLLPTPSDLFVRRFLPIRSLQEQRNSRYELHGLPQDSVSEVPTLSGCFLAMRSIDLLAIEGFDERFFMYMEDVDLVRRLGLRGAIRYLPEVHVVHEYAKGSYRSRKLLGYHLKSAILYFNKWGWLIDSYRRRVNAACLERLGGKKTRPN